MNNALAIIVFGSGIALTPGAPALAGGGFGSVAQPIGATSTEVARIDLASSPSPAQPGPNSSSK